MMRVKDLCITNSVQLRTYINMRMWMVDPKIMCRKHLLGEHVEIHMFNGHIRRGRQIYGYVKSNCVEVLSMNKRHDEIASEMIRRHYKHNSPLNKISSEDLSYLGSPTINAKVDSKESLKDLITRCSECRERAGI